VNLTREAVVAQALGIVDQYGLPDLTMRRLATTLGVQPSALYWHFASKQDLLGAMAAVILADLPPYSGDLTRLTVWAARLHALLRRHRSGAELVWAVETLRPWEAGVGYAVEQALVQTCLAPALARTAARGVLSLVLAYAFDEDQRQLARSLGVSPPEPAIDPARDLDDAVAVFVAGIERAC
jgi:AcrR family transcriptional regulator